MSATVGGQASGFGWFTTWVDQHLALCLTFARGLSPEQMLEGLGLEPRHVVEETFEEAAESSAREGPRKVRVGERDGWAYAVENSTQRGLPSLGRLSTAGGEALALVYTPTISAFQYWAHGELVNGFDLLLPRIRWGRDLHRFDTTMEQAGFLGRRLPEPPAMSVRFVQLTFGITLDQGMLERALPSAELN